MESKRIILIMVIVLVVIGVLLSMTFLLQKQKESKELEVGIFDLTKYKWEIDNYPIDKNVGQVDDKNVAVEKAKSLWLEKSYIDNDQMYRFVKEIKVAYDSEEECWHIYGIVSQNTLGGVLHSIIRKNGEVIAVWIED